MPVALPLMVPFLILLAALTSLALHQTENQWLRPLLESLAHPRGSFIKKLALRSAGLLVSGVLYVEKHVRAALSHFAAAGLATITTFLHGLTHLWNGMASEIGAIADDVADALGYLRHHTIPHLIHAATAPIARVAHDAYADARRSISLIRDLRHDFTRGIDRLEHGIKAWVLTRIHGIDRLLREGVLPRIRTVERRIGNVITRDLPALRRREAALEREVYGDLRARIGRIEKALGLGVFAAVVYRILAKVAPWLFCRNVNKLGRVVCGLDQNTMNALVATLLGTLALRDLETIARFGAAIEREVADEVKRLLDV